MWVWVRGYVSVCVCARGARRPGGVRNERIHTRRKACKTGKWRLGSTDSQWRHQRASPCLHTCKNGDALPNSSRSPGTFSTSERYWRGAVRVSGTRLHCAKIASTSLMFARREMPGGSGATGVGGLFSNPICLLIRPLNETSDAIAKNRADSITPMQTRQYRRRCSRACTRGSPLNAPVGARWDLFT